MTSRLSITEKIISISLVIWGGLTLFYTSRGLFNFMEVVTRKDLSLLTTFKNVHILLLLPIATILAGALLFFDKKSGWTLSLIVLLLNGLMFLIPSNNHTHNFTSRHSDVVLALLVTAIACLIFFFILVQKPFLAKYHPTNRTWLTVALITIAIIFDRTLIF
ncbi:MAG: hypothetical protein ABIU77_05735, partial [Ferruginibacter sp.]